MNVRGAYLHILGDLLGSIGALLAAGAIALFGLRWADPAISVVISGIIVFGALRLVLDAVNVLMEGAPAHLDARAVQERLGALPGVAGVHDLHLWSLGGDHAILTAHLVLDHSESAGVVLRGATRMLADAFDIRHATLQLEPPDYNIVQRLD
jgi:cobalt-zinc-cadmium efflux system protein